MRYGRTEKSERKGGRGGGRGGVGGPNILTLRRTLYCYVPRGGLGRK
jgi:hypothetical protein